MMYILTVAHTVLHTALVVFAPKQHRCGTEASKNLHRRYSLSRITNHHEVSIGLNFRS